MTQIRYLRQSDMLKCKFAIMVPEHYREDGTCMCDDLEHRKMMIKEWGYKSSQFRGIPLHTPTTTPWQDA